MSLLNCIYVDTRYERMITDYVFQFYRKFFTTKVTLIFCALHEIRDASLLRNLFVFFFQAFAICTSKNMTRYQSRFPLAYFFWREQAKSECDWVVMSSVFVASQSHCFSSVRASKLKSGNTCFVNVQTMSN
jgi:nitric oxide reductase large subunit